MKNEKPNFNKKIKDKVVKVEEISDSNPSWYHYLIVLLVFFVIVYGIYFILNFEQSNSEFINISNNTLTQTEPYIYKHVIGNNTYNLQFQTPLEELNNTDLLINANKYDILNSKKIIFSFYIYNGTDNKFVSISSVKLMKLFKYLFKFDFSANDFKLYNQYNCSTSTLDDKVIMFNPYSNISGVYYNKISGCIEINARTPQEIVSVTDTFIYTLVNQ